MKRRISCCTSLMFGSGVESVAPKSDAFRAILEVLHVVETRADCRWIRKECDGMTGMESEALQL